MAFLLFGMEKHKAGYAVVTAEQVLEAKSFPPGNQCSMSGACGSDLSSRVKLKGSG